MALRLLLLAAFATHAVAAYFESDLRELCGGASRSPQLLLTSRGARSAALLHLSEQHRERCLLTVAVPYMHQLALRLFLQPEPPPPGTICPLSIVREDDGALLPLCASDGIPLERLRGRQVSLLWAPPANETDTAAGWAPTELLITALSRGRSCQAPQLVTCRGRTRRSSLCVSRALACDGYSNCPRGEDEAPELCAAAAAAPACCSRRAEQRAGRVQSVGVPDAGDAGDGHAAAAVRPVGVLPTAGRRCGARGRHRAGRGGTRAAPHRHHRRRCLRGGAAAAAAALRVARPAALLRPALPRRQGEHRVARAPAAVGGSSLSQQGLLVKQALFHGAREGRLLSFPVSSFPSQVQPAPSYCKVCVVMTLLQ